MKSTLKYAKVWLIFITFFSAYRSVEQDASKNILIETTDKKHRTEMCCNRKLCKLKYFKNSESAELPASWDICTFAYGV